MRNLQKLKFAHERAFRKHGKWVPNENAIYTEVNLKSANQQEAIIHCADVVDGDYTALMHNMMPTLLEAVEALKRLYAFDTEESTPPEVGTYKFAMLESCKSVLEKL